MTKETFEYSKYIDHTVLKADTSLDDIRLVCSEAIEYGFAAVCIPPYFLEVGEKLLNGSSVALSTVIGFPLGYQHVVVKIEECKKAIESGADELDVVVNIAAIKSNDWEYVSQEINSIATAIKMKDKVVKLIFETAYLTDEQIIRLCSLCIEHKVDFAKTSTGFAPSGATVRQVALMKEHLKGKVKIKASGGIKNKKTLINMVNAGADRIGTSSGVQIVNE